MIFLLRATDFVSWFAAALLLVAATLKLRAPRDARQFLLELGLPSGGVAAAAIASFEAVVGVAVLAVSATRPARAAEAGLFLAFATAVAYYMHRKQTRVISCGCFGTGTGVHAVTHLMASGLLALSSAVAVFTSRPSLLGSRVETPVLDFVSMNILLVALVAATGTYAGTSAVASDPFTETFRAQAETDRRFALSQVR